MISKELNLKLIEAIPEICDIYYEETSWQDGDETGSHVIYADVFVPFLKEQLIIKNEPLLFKAFDYIENLLELDDEYANEVIALSVLESLIFDEDVDNSLFMQFVKTKTLELINELLFKISEFQCIFCGKSIKMRKK